MKFFLIAGEPSGDQHAAALITAIRKIDPEAQFAFFGGEQMEAAAEVKAVVPLSDLAFMGFSQLVTKASRIRENFRRCHEAILSFEPDVLVPVDYGGFNLRMIRWAKRQDLRVVYYIPPKTWAWMPGRTGRLARYTNRVLVTLPFEEPFFRQRGVHAVYVGNPVAEQLEPARTLNKELLRENLGLDEAKVIALLPGSRHQELSDMLPVMAGIIDYFPDYQFVIAAHDRFTDDQIREFAGKSNLLIIRGKTHELLAIADAALVTSGTATLETALLGTPQIVCYRTAPTSYLIARMLIQVRHISLVNLILEEACVPELIQGDLTDKKLRQELLRILEDQDYRNRMLLGYDRLKGILGRASSSETAARWVVDTAKGLY
ncbi:MAG: lipid-A-disaccharide synthase [Bacteroidales bacterium]